jgi:preprotein translocase subunit SecE
MAFSLYKSGQGYWTRTLSAVGVAVLVLSGVAWLWNELEVIKSKAVPTIYLQSGMAVAIIVCFAALTWWLLNKPKIADFMIATEQEMKKVNWPSRHELTGSTIVVIGGTFLMALLLYVFDIFFLWLFGALRILNI